MNQETSYDTQRIDHLGIVAGICRETSLVERIDAKVGGSQRKESCGQAVMALVLNALGFSGRALYLMPENSGQELELFLVRMLFCLFADDTAVFEKDSFRYYLEERKQMQGIAGFFGASSIERLPTERAITGQVRAFKEMLLG